MKIDNKLQEVIKKIVYGSIVNQKQIGCDLGELKTTNIKYYMPIICRSLEKVDSNVCKNKSDFVNIIIEFLTQINDYIPEDILGAEITFNILSNGDVATLIKKN